MIRGGKSNRWLLLGLIVAAGAAATAGASFWLYRQARAVDEARFDLLAQYARKEIEHKGEGIAASLEDAVEHVWRDGALLSASPQRSPASTPRLNLPGWVAWGWWTNANAHSSRQRVMELSERPAPFWREEFYWELAQFSEPIALDWPSGRTFLLKESDARRIVSAIHSVLRGRSVFDPVTGRHFMDESSRADGEAQLLTLTPQERRVLSEVAEGKADKDVGAALGLSAKTVRNYLDRVFEKLRVNTRTQAAMLYARHRLPADGRYRERHQAKEALTTMPRNW